jgi:3-oxoacyl-[acyl-carrier-protein] synthase III
VSEHEPVGIRSLGVCLGETVLSLPELATIHGVREDAIRDALGSRIVRVTRRSRLDLAQEAAEACLREAGLRGSDVDVVVDVRATRDEASDSEPPLAPRVGAQSALSLSMTAPCGATLAVIECAQAWLSGSSARRVLVVYSEVHPYGYRCSERISENTITNMLSDGAAAALLERGGSFRLAGFGFAANNETWEVARRILHGDPMAKEPRSAESRPEVQKLLTDFVRLPKLALERWKATSDHPFDSDDLAVSTALLPANVRLLANALGLRASLIDYDHRCHVFGADCIIALAELKRAGRLPRGRILVGDIGFGQAAFAGFEVVGSRG